MRIHKFLIVLTTVFGSFARANTGITYAGRLVKSDGTAVESSNVQFRLQIRTPGSENCLMYEEEKTIDMTGSKGGFALTINDGLGQRQDSSGLTIDRIFGNRGTFTFAPSTCSVTNTFTPNVADGRQLVVLFNDGTFSGWEALPPMAINYVPSSIESVQVGGFKADNLLRVQDGAGVPQSVTPLSATDFSELLNVVAGTSSKYMQSNSATGATLPTTTPSSPTAGSLWYDGGALKYFDGASTRTLGTSSGTVTDVTAGAGLTGGTISTSGTIALATVGSAGSAAKVNYDVYGRVTGASSLLETDLPTISTAGKVSGDAITSGTIGGSASVNTTGNVTAANLSASNAGVKTLEIYKTDLSSKVTISAPPSLGSAYGLVLPVDDGNPGQLLATDGSGNLSWSSNAISNGASLANGKIWIGDGSGKAQEQTLSGDASVSATGVVTLATVPLAKGGTGLTAGGSANQILGMNAAGTALEYKSVTAGAGITLTPSAGGLQIASSGGTVTSVGFTAPSIFTVTGSPLTSSGSIDLGLNAQLANMVFAGPASGSAAPAFRALNIADIRSTNTGAFLTGSACAAGQALVYSSVSDTISCQTLSLTSAQVTTALGYTPLSAVSNTATLANGKIWVGDAGGKAQEATMTGDAAISNAGALTIANNAVTNAKIADVSVSKITSSSGAYFVYKPNNVACNDGEVLKWDATNSRWACATDAGSAGTVASLTVNAPIVKTGTASDPILSVSDATVSAKGIVQLATSAQTTAGLAVQASDTRLSDARTPTAHTHGVDEITSGASKYLTYKPNNTACANNEILKWDNTNSRWICGTDSGLTAESDPTVQAYAKAAPSADFSTPANVLTLNTVGVAKGGTGATSLTAGSLLVGNGTSAVTSLAAGAAGNVIYGAGAASWASGTPDTAGLVDKASTQTISGTKTFSNVVTGTLKVTGGTPAANKVLMSDASGNATWQNELVTSVATKTGAVVLDFGDITNAASKYLAYKPNNAACTDGQVLSWDNTNSRWICGTMTAAGVSSISGTAPVVVGGTASVPSISVSAASTSAAGVVQLAASADTTAGLVVQANDTRLTNSRAPTGSAGGDLTGTYPSPTLSAVGTAGTYAKVTTDSKGRVTSGSATIDYGDVANAASKYLTYKPNNAACANNEILKWDNTNSRWICATAGSLVTESDPTVAGFAKNAPSSDFSTPSNVLTLNTVPAAKGGTGLTALGTANQVLGINAAGTAMEYKTLTAGSGVTITPTAGVLTISASGSESTSVSNVGVGGVGVYSAMSGTQIQLKNINAASSAITVTNDVANKEVDIGVNAELGGLSGLSANGFVKRTGAGTYSSSSSVSLTSDVTGVLPVASGGTGVSSIGNFMVMGTNGSGAVSPVAGTVNGSVLQYSATGPVYSTASFPSTTSANQLLYSSANNVVGGLATANSAVLTTNASGVPSFTALSSDPFSTYALLAGRASGQTINGGSVGSTNLTLDSNSTGSKGYVLLNPSAGNVGVGTTTPATRLDVSGAIRSVAVNAGAATTLDWSLGNVMYTTTGCSATAYTMNNMQDGASYTLIIKASSHSAACSFTGSGVSSWRFYPASATPTGHVVLTILKAGTDAYISWVDTF